MARVKRKPVIISPRALQDIEAIIHYLKNNWSQRVVDSFLQKLEVFYQIISANPRIFGYYSKSRNIRHYAISRHNVIYYRNRRKEVEIITVFDTRQSPAKLKKTLSAR